jgi:hypothetical protein
MHDSPCTCVCPHGERCPISHGCQLAANARTVDPARDCCECLMHPRGEWTTGACADFAPLPPVPTGSTNPNPSTQPEA